MLHKPKSPKKSFLRISCLSLAAIACFAAVAPKQAEAFETPDILVLGDSQITFGSGPSFLSFFQNLTEHCGTTRRDKRLLSKLDMDKVAVIGVRSTSLGTWTKRSKTGKKAICDVDPNWNVNAGSYGTINTSENIYIQIGQGKNYQFCKPNKSAFESMLREDYYNPKLLMMSFLGNSSRTWAEDPEAALHDVQTAMGQLPPGMPCVFMTTAPTYQKKVVDQRLKAQQNLKKAFEKTGNRCSFVEGFTPETINANLGVKTHFRRKKSGAVKDPFHPNEVAAEKFFELQKTQICNAVLEQLR